MSFHALYAMEIFLGWGIAVLNHIAGWHLPVDSLINVTPEGKKIYSLPQKGCYS